MLNFAEISQELLAKILLARRAEVLAQAGMEVDAEHAAAHADPEVRKRIGAELKAQINVTSQRRRAGGGE